MKPSFRLVEGRRGHLPTGSHWTTAKVGPDLEEGLRPVVVLTRLSLASRAVVILISAVIIGFGLYATRSLKQELYPSLTIPSATVVAVYPGAPPETVESDVTKPIEDAARAVAGVTKVSSASSANLSTVTVEWDYQADGAAIESKLRTAVDGVRSALPKDVDPTVTVGSLDDIPVALLAVSSDQEPSALADELKRVAVPKLTALPGVRDVRVSGEQPRAVTITTRQADLDKYKVDPSQLSALLPVYKTSIPAGQVVQDGRNVSVQVGAPVTTVEALKNIRLQGTDGSVPLSAVADVVEGPKEATSLSRVNGAPALSLSITKTQDANTVTVSHDVSRALAGLTAELGHNTTFTPVFDQAPYIEQSIHDLGTEGGLGLGMAILVILVFLLSIRSTLITAISIPMSLLIAMIGLYFSGYTLNLLTLSALTVAVGRVVDDSIVVIENIKRHQGLGEDWGTGLIVGAVREVAGAVTASTITTVAVFLPLGVVSGQVGELFRPFALTVTVALLASLVVALTVVPVLAYWFMRPTARQAARIADGLAGGTRASHETEITPMQKRYLPALHWALRRPKITILIAVALVGATIAAATQLKTDFLGASEQTELSISQTLPVGTSLADTDAAAHQVEAILGADPDVRSYQVSVGSSGLEAELFGGAGATNKASYTVSLKPEAKGLTAVDRLRTQLSERPELGEIEVQGTDASGSSRLAVEVHGLDDADLAAASDQVTAMMSGIPGVSQASSDLTEKQTVWQVNVREADAARYGMNQGTVGQAVTAAVQGQTLGQVRIGNSQEDVVLRSREPVRTREQLQGLTLPVTERQTADVRQGIADDITRIQDQQTAKQQAQADQQLNDQAAQLREQRRTLEDQLAGVTGQITALQNAPVTGATVDTAPTDPAQAQAAAAAQAIAQRDAQVQQLRKSADQLRTQLTALSDSEAKLADSRQQATAQQRTAAQLQRMSQDAQSATGTPRTLTDVADVTDVPAAATINKIDGQRTVTVTATLTGDDLGAASAAIQRGLGGLHLPSGVTASMGGVSTEQQNAFNQLIIAMLVAIAIVYMVMVATFRSLVQPLILLVSVPFAATGAVGLLLLTRTALGIPSMVGLLMLIGIVVTNAIVLIDLINHYRSQGSGIDDAVMHGARLRLRPIIMTALATIMALVPMAIGITGGGVFISRSLAIVVIGGLVSSTLLTLILVPVLYHLVENLREGMHRRRHRGGSSEPRRAAKSAEADIDTLLDGGSTPG